MTAENSPWSEAVLQGLPGLLVRTLLERLDSAENAQQRATARDDVVAQFLNVHQHSHQLAVILDTVLSTKHKEEFNEQLNVSQACRQLRQMSDTERARDKQRHDANQRTACCTAVENWGRGFLGFASRHGWFDKKGTFWREARAASNRVPDWTVAKSMLDLALVKVHLMNKDWEPVVDQGYLAMTRMSDLMSIANGAERLDAEIASALHLQFDETGDINFANWQEISHSADISLLKVQQPSGEDSLLSSRSSISPATSPRQRRVVSKNSRRKRASSAPVSRISKGTGTGSTQGNSKHRKKKRHTHGSRDLEQPSSRSQKATESPTLSLTDQPATETYLQECGTEERDNHTGRGSVARSLLANAYKHMKSTLDRARDNAPDRSMDRRDELFNFALNCLQSPSLALEWNSKICKTLRDRADVLCLNDSEAMELINTQHMIEKPVIIRGNQCEYPDRASWFFTSLVNEHGLESTLDVQGTGLETIAQPTTLQELQGLIFQPSSEAGSRDFRPINCLKVPLIESQEGDPPFMCHPRFMIGDEICRRMRKVVRSSYKASLLEDSRRFNLLSTVLTVSEFHKDAFNCTWVKCLAGVKAWFFLKTDAQNYEEPDPRDMRVILLFPGDVIFMPAGLPVPHAVVTVDGPCVMAGGQRLDAKCLLPQLKEILNMMQHSGTTNEDLPLPEFKSILKDIIRQIRERPAEFDSPQDLAGSISSILSSL